MLSKVDRILTKIFEEALCPTEKILALIIIAEILKRVSE